MIHIAIDPGLTGAIAAIDEQAQLVICEDLPVIDAAAAHDRQGPGSAR